MDILVKNAYIELMNDNLINLIKYIYKNSIHQPYNNVVMRIKLIMFMIQRSSKKYKIPFSISSKIAKDIDEVMYNTTLMIENQNKMKLLSSWLNLLRTYTDNKDTITLNTIDEYDDKSVYPNITSEMVTLNVVNSTDSANQMNPMNQMNPVGQMNPEEKSCVIS